MTQRTLMPTRSERPQDNHQRWAFPAHLLQRSLFYNLNPLCSLCSVAELGLLEWQLIMINTFGLWLITWLITVLTLIAVIFLKHIPEPGLKHFGVTNLQLNLKLGYKRRPSWMHINRESYKDWLTDWTRNVQWSRIFFQRYMEGRRYQSQLRVVYKRSIEHGTRWDTILCIPITPTHEEIRTFICSALIVAVDDEINQRQKPWKIVSSYRRVVSCGKSRQITEITEEKEKINSQITSFIGEIELDRFYSWK